MNVNINKYKSKPKYNRNKQNKLKSDWYVRFHNKKLLTEMIHQILDHNLFYPNTRIITAHNIIKSDDKVYFLKPDMGRRQESIKILNKETDITKAIHKHILRHHYKSWLLQEAIDSYLVVIPNHVQPRKMCLRCYYYIDNINQSGIDAYIFPHVIVTIFHKPFENYNDSKQNMCLNAQTLGDKKASEWLFNLKTLFPDDYEDIFNQMKDVLRKITCQYYEYVKHIENYKLRNIFGVDWILDTNKKIWLLEINNGPDIRFYNKIVSRDLLKEEVNKIKNGNPDMFLKI